MNKLENSSDLLARAMRVIPSGTQTFSKGPTQWVRGVSPSYLQRGDGAWVWDVDGNRYLDHLMALGPIILGYNNAAVNDAVAKQVVEGAVFSQMHPLEVEVAEILVDLVPCAEMVRFGKNGSDATTAAIRAARAFTGRSRIACCGYHGWHDWFIGTTTRDLGVPEEVAALTHTFGYNDLPSLQRLFDENPGEIAAVMMEPVGVEAPEDNFLQKVLDLCHAEGALLIFDEIVTGFRFGLGGGQEFFGVTPDLACLGKGLANGLPLSAIVGKREIMEIFDDIFFSGTFGGEAISLAACKATINELQKLKALSHIERYGERLMAEMNALIETYGLQSELKVLGYPVRSVLSFPHDDEQETRVRRSFFMQECVKRGLLYFGSHVPCYAHGDRELEFTVEVLQKVMPMFAAAHQQNDFADRLEGQCVDAIFRKP
jgi:glutamate-1-semialdehyde aminotransferase